VVAANTSFDRAFNGSVLVDFDLSQGGRNFKIAYSNQGSSGNAAVQMNPGQVFPLNGTRGLPVASLPVALKPQEVQVLVPV
jgi:hypothetical protein